jgi:hypothetical protein
MNHARCKGNKYIFKIQTPELRLLIYARDGIFYSKIQVTVLIRQ